MSSAPQIVVRYCAADDANSVLIVNDASFPALMSQASSALRLPPESIVIVYDDDEGETVTIASQAELEEALLQHGRRLECRLTRRFAPVAKSSPLSTRAISNRRLSAVRRPQLKKLSLSMIVGFILCLASAFIVFVTKPVADTDLGQTCPSLMQIWSNAIESGTTDDNIVLSPSIYRLLVVCPQDLAQYWIGRYEYEQGNVYNALERFRSASKLSPAHAPSHLWTGRCLNWLDRAADALQAFATAAHLAPYLAEAQFEFGRALSSTDAVASAALAAVSAAVAADPNLDDARLLKGRLAYEMGDTDSAYSDFAILVERHPNSSEYRIWKRRVFDDILLGR